MTKYKELIMFVILIVLLFTIGPAIYIDFTSWDYRIALLYLTFFIIIFLMSVVIEKRKK